MFDIGIHKTFVERISKPLPFYNDVQSKLVKGYQSVESVLACARTCSPYLNRLHERWPDIIADIYTRSPEDMYEEIKTGLTPAPYERTKVALRQAKQKVHFLTALCDLAGIWNWEHVTAVLSDFADKAMQLLILSAAEDTGFEDSERGPIQGLFVLALGKYGGYELNYSSDIDVIVFYDPDHIKVPRNANAERVLIRFVKKLMRGFDAITPDGYIFRTDLRLRPDPRSNAVAISTVTAERYYESLGQNWERAAMIKARFCGGDPLAAEEFIKNVLTPFIWRRSLDYAAIADIHSIKRQIQGEAEIADVCIAGHDLKLGLGGIREIEFYTQVQQLILGGRNKNLRTPRTIDALQALVSGQYTPKNTAMQLTKDYSVLRDLEHRAQMYDDQQTHLWPLEQEHRLKLMAMSGADDLDMFERGLVTRLTRVHQTYAALFPDEEDLSAKKGSLVFTGVELEASTEATLQSYGFLRSHEVWQLMADWLGGRIRSTKTQRARELLTRLAPRIIEACGANGAPDVAFFGFAEFITSLNAGVTLFSLFLNKPEALISVIDMLAIAPSLAKTLSENTALIDAMVEPDFVKQTMQINQDHYFDLVKSEPDFETALDIIRRAVHEDQFSLTASLLKLQSIDNAGQVFSSIAQAAIGALLPKAVQETERTSGKIKGDYAVLGMGKLGSREMGLKSDLDLIVVYETGASPPNEPCESEQISFNKLTRRLITALSSVTSAGGLYEVDMALRPSGRSGPLAVAVDAFDTYYETRAWTWEYMALCRAQVVAASSDGFARLIEEKIKTAILKKDFTDILANDVLDMHRRLARDKPAKGTWDIKGSVGGLRDIEFIGQFLVLKHKSAVRPLGLIDILLHAQSQAWISNDEGKLLLDAARFYHSLSQILAVTVDSVFDPDQTPNSVKELLVKSTKAKNYSEFMQKLEIHKTNVSRLFERIIT